MNSEWRLSMRPSRLRSVARRSLVAVVALVQAALVAVAAPPAHAAGSLGTVTVSSDVTVKEPASPGAPSTATFDVVLARTGPGTVTVDYHTVAGTATPDVDYASTSGSLVLSGSVTTASVPV